MNRKFQLKTAEEPKMMKKRPNSPLVHDPADTGCERRKLSKDAVEHLINADYRFFASIGRSIDAVVETLPEPLRKTFGYYYRAGESLARVAEMEGQPRYGVQVHLEEIFEALLDRIEAEKHELQIYLVLYRTFGALYNSDCFPEFSYED